MDVPLSSVELSALLHVSRTVNAHLDLNAVLHSIMDVTTDVMAVAAASLVLVDSDTGELLFYVATGDKAKALEPLRLAPGTGIVGAVVQSGETMVVNDAAADPRFDSSVDAETGFTTKSILCVPLATQDRIWGAIEVLNRRDEAAFTSRDQALCEAVAGQAAIAIANARLHSELLAAERLAAIGQTIAGMAHCIKNVLNGVSGGSYMVDRGLRQDDLARTRRGWEIVKKNTSFMQELVLDMLTCCKTREPAYAAADIHELLQSVSDLVATDAAAKGVSVVVTPGEALNEVVIDPKGIRRCVLNLASNAVDACEGLADAKVELAAAARGADRVAITVSDTGCGISEADRARLFHVFFSTKGSRGTGLGLAVTQKIVSEHRGAVDVDSRIGEGTTFTIVLPRKPEGAQPFAGGPAC